MTRIAIATGAVALLAIASLSSAVHAQSGRATMHGYVEFDGVGRNNVKAREVVARIELIAVDDDGNQSPPIVSNTDDVGIYEVRDIPAGDYILRISSPGFRTYETELYLPSDIDCRIATRLKKA